MDHSLHRFSSFPHIDIKPSSKRAGLHVVRCSSSSSAPGLQGRLPPPPSPPSLPLFGHFHHLVGQVPHLAFQRLARTYGPVVSLRLGAMEMVVVSDMEAARQVLKVQDASFASRPKFATTKHVLYDCKDMVFSDYTSQLKETKKFLITELLSSKKMAMFTGVKSEELSWLVQSLADMSSAKQEFEVRDYLVGFGYNVITRILIGKRYYGVPADKKHEVEAGAKFRKVLSDAIDIGVAGSVSDFFPWLEFLDWQIPNSKKVHKAVDEFLQEIMNEHRKAQGNQQEAKDFLDMMLPAPCFENQEDRIKALLFDIIAGGTDSSSTYLEWALAELMKHPEVLKRVQEEVRSVVGSKPRVEEGDIVRMPYLQAVVKEAFRLHPPVPLLVPHLANRDCELKGYSIRAGTIVFINVYTMGRDPNTWSDPLKFEPERFLNKEVDILGHGQGFELIPFGSGRRSCPGSALGLSTVHLALATLVHCFDWQANQDIDFTAKSAATNIMLHPLKVRIRPRAPAQNYTYDFASTSICG